MSNYSLAPNEGIILQCDGVNHDHKCSELVLTNQNLICVETNSGLFKKTTYNVIKFPIRQIKVVNGQVQAFASKDGNLQIFFFNGEEIFLLPNQKPLKGFLQGKSTADEWVEQINLVLTGNPVSDSSDDSLLGGIKKTLGSVGINFKAKSPDKLTAKCIGCMAPISGLRGQTVRCKYCDTNQTL